MGAETEAIWVVFVLVRALPNNQRFGIVCLVVANALLSQIVTVSVFHNQFFYINSVSSFQSFLRGFRML